MVEGRGDRHWFAWSEDWRREGWRRVVQLSVCNGWSKDRGDLKSGSRKLIGYETVANSDWIVKTKVNTHTRLEGVGGVRESKGGLPD